ncbi:hypothetical protein [Candidatus Hydrogenosomobacter endosymbioticus]|nr:hypothetical protein [Candidatus Hydrogenosomobacter endosymbioticus]
MNKLTTLFFWCTLLAVAQNTFAGPKPLIKHSNRANTSSIKPRHRSVSQNIKCSGQINSQNKWQKVTNLPNTKYYKRPADQSTKLFIKIDSQNKLLPQQSPEMDYYLSYLGPEKIQELLTLKKDVCRALPWLEEKFREMGNINLSNSTNNLKSYMEKMTDAAWFENIDLQNYSRDILRKAHLMAEEGVPIDDAETKASIYDLSSFSKNNSKQNLDDLLF